MDYIKKAREVIDIEIQGLEMARDSLTDSFTKAVDLASACADEGHKLVVTGIGKNWHIAQKISATLASTGTTSVVLNPTQAMHGDLGILAEGDVLIVLSYSGESEELITLLPEVRRAKVSIITMTGNTKSALAQNSDLVVSVEVVREACPFNMAPSASTTATLAMGDALAIVILEARGFKKEDYAKLHPGGAIGRALLLKVSDIMRKKDRLASVGRDAKVRDALVAMTQVRAGSAVVVDENGKVLGIFTDGDLRRHIAERDDLLETPVGEVMTVDPTTVSADQLAVDVLSVYEKLDIDDLIVVDESGVLVGVVDIQDLPGLKIM